MDLLKIQGISKKHFIKEKAKNIQEDFVQYYPDIIDVYYFLLFLYSSAVRPVLLRNSFMK